MLSNGHLIYSGPLQDLKGRMRRNHYELDFEGEQKTIARALQAIKTIGEVKYTSLQHRRLTVQLQDDAVAAPVLAQVLAAVHEAKVGLVGVRSVGQQTEEAYLDLVEKEEQRGFTRIYRQAA